MWLEKARILQYVVIENFFDIVSILSNNWCLIDDISR